MRKILLTTVLALTCLFMCNNDIVHASEEIKKTDNAFQDAELVSFNSDVNEQIKDGKHTDTLAFTDSKETCSEPDNDFETAFEINDGQSINGYFAVNDKKDVYKITVSKECRLSVDVTADMSGYEVSIFDSNKKAVYTMPAIYWDGLDDVTTTNHYVDVEAGTYYIVMSIDWERYGAYQLKATACVWMSDCEITLERYVAYTGKEVNSPMTIRYNGQNLKEGIDYTTEYEKNIRLGIASVKITGIGKYAGSVYKKFEIVAKAGTKVDAGYYKVKILSDSEVAICGFAGEGIETLNINDSIYVGGKEFEVTEIAEKAFYKKTKISSVNLSDSIKKVGKKLFMDVLI